MSSCKYRREQVRTYAQAFVQRSMQQCSADCSSGVCSVACKDQRYERGKVYTLRFSPDTIDFMKKSVANPKEVGMLLEPNFQTGLIELMGSSGGGKDSVEIPRGVYQAHTHPNACRSRTSCYFDFPSENDMALIAHDSMKGVVAHFVVSVERVYRVALSPALRLRFARSPRDLELVFAHFSDVMNRLQSRASEEGIDVLPSLLQEWLREAREYGFAVDLFETPAHVVERLRAF